nr:uncharacterized protein LOC129385574 isoform X1 [Dermacentor andersoni]
MPGDDPRAPSSGTSHPRLACPAKAAVLPLQRESTLQRRLLSQGLHIQQGPLRRQGGFTREMTYPGGNPPRGPGYPPHGDQPPPPVKRVAQANAAAPATQDGPPGRDHDHGVKQHDPTVCAHRGWRTRARLTRPPPGYGFSRSIHRFILRYRKLPSVFLKAFFTVNPGADLTEDHHDPPGGMAPPNDAAPPHHLHSAMVFCAKKSLCKSEFSRRRDSRNVVSLLSVVVATNIPGPVSGSRYRPGSGDHAATGSRTVVVATNIPGPVSGSRYRPGSGDHAATGSRTVVVATNIPGPVSGSRYRPGSGDHAATGSRTVVVATNIPGPVSGSRYRPGSGDHAATGSRTKAAATNDESRYILCPAGAVTAGRLRQHDGRGGKCRARP